MTLERDDTFDLPPDYEDASPAKKRGVKPNDITVAMLSPESDVDLPGMRHPGSIVSCLIALNVGENFTKSLLVDDSVNMASLQNNLNEWKHTLRHTVNQAIRRAREYDRRTLSMETSQTITPTGRVYVQVIVTRTE